jgi:hypothetical protein
MKMALEKGYDAVRVNLTSLDFAEAHFQGVKL